MKLQDQVCSLDLAKKLKELGFEQESLFWWFESNDKKDTLLCFDAKLPNEYSYDFKKSCSAYTVAELLENLPKMIHNFDKTNYQGDLYLYYLTGDKEWVIGYKCYCPVLKAKEERLIPNFIDKNLANACAKMLIYLKTNNLL